MLIKFLDKFNQFENELCEVVRAFGIEVEVVKLEEYEKNITKSLQMNDTILPNFHITQNDSLNIAINEKSFNTLDMEDCKDAFVKSYNEKKLTDKTDNEKKLTNKTDNEKKLTDKTDNEKSGNNIICEKSCYNKSNNSKNEIHKDILIFDMQDFEEYLELSVEFNHYKHSINFKKIDNKLKEKSLYKREAKVLIYDCIATITNSELPYGALMGIRPTKMFREILLSGQNAREYFLNDMRATNVKVNLIESVVKNQLPVYSFDTKDIDLFINIPICTSRCSYCTFISHELKRVVKQIPAYIQQLRREINQALLIIKNYNLRSIYVGGGTPTAIDAESLNYILSPLKDFKTLEFTVEAGRPDTITYEKLEVLKNNNVNRISINPQSFNQKTLDLIGRTHSVEDFYTAYDMAKKLKFDINMDLIATLPNESFEDFKFSVDKTLQLEPQNITVHTLSLKRGSKLTEENYKIGEDGLAKKMVDYSIEKISEKYNPYYMYRLKNISGGLENIGYALKGKESVYNVDIMEESVSIIACGAGGISKRLYENNRLERCANPKGIDIYLQRENEILQRKQDFFNQD